MKKTFAIITIPFNLKGENENEACMVETGFETQEAAEKHLQQTDILDISDGSPYIICVVPTYQKVLQPV